MRVALFSLGLAAYTVQQADGLCHCGHHVQAILLANDLSGLRASFPVFMGETSADIIGYGGNSLPLPWRLAAMAVVGHKVLRFHPDILHITLPTPVLETLLIARYAWVRGIPVVLTLHDIGFHPGDRWPRGNFTTFVKILETAHHIIVHGESLRKEARELLFAGDSRISVVPHGHYGICTENAAAATTGEPPTILFFGRMKRYKGLDVLLDAAAILETEFPPARIVVAGKGPELDRLQSACARRENVVVINAYIDNKETAVLFASCAIVVIPYIEASQSGPLLMAYAFGRPVVASAVGAIPEMLTHEKEGLLVAPGDARALADALLRLLRDPPDARRMGNAGLRRTAGDLNWRGDLGQRFASLYADLLSRRGGLQPLASQKKKARRNALHSSYEAHQRQTIA